MRGGASIGPDTHLVHAEEKVQSRRAQLPQLPGVCSGVRETISKNWEGIGAAQRAARRGGGRGGRAGPHRTAMLLSAPRSESAPLDASGALAGSGWASWVSAEASRAIIFGWRMAKGNDRRVCLAAYSARCLSTTSSSMRAMSSAISRFCSACARRASAFLAAFAFFRAAAAARSGLSAHSASRASRAATAALRCRAASA